MYVKEMAPSSRIDFRTAFAEAVFLLLFETEDQVMSPCSTPMASDRRKASADKSYEKQVVYVCMLCIYVMYVYMRF